jgi:2-haloalkanoic acid dehalogenase type II
MSSPSLPPVKVLTFDLIGTIVDEEAGLYSGFEPLLSRLTPPPSQKESLIEFTEHEQKLMHSSPHIPFEEVLRRSYLGLANTYGINDVSEEEAQRFVDHAGSWPPFSDSVSALNKLKEKHGLKLFILTNLNRANLNKQLAGPLSGVKFDGAFSSTEIGSYKPSIKNFEYLLEELRKKYGIDDKDEILHVAQGLVADHVPAPQIGLKGVWISRRRGEFSSKENFDNAFQRAKFLREFTSLDEFEQAVGKDGAST